MNWFPVFVFISLLSLSSGGIAVEKRSLAADDDKDDMFGRVVIGQMLGTDSVGLDGNSFQLSNSSDLTQIIAEYIYEIFKRDDKTFKEQCVKLLESEDLEEKYKILGELSGNLEKVVTGSDLREALMEDPRFLEQYEKAIKNGGNSGNAIQTDKSPCNGPVPDIGKVDGFYGSQSKLTMTEELKAAKEKIKTNSNVNGAQLALLEYGLSSKPNPESRLGAFYATRGYKPGSVGSTIHRIIGGLYLFLGSAGEEKIGRIYNNQVVKALLSQPIESDAIRCLASIEDLYYKNVQKENPESAGGALGSVVTLRTRDCLTQLLSGVFCSSE